MVNFNVDSACQTCRRMRSHARFPRILLSSMMTLGMVGAAGGGAIAMIPQTRSVESPGTGTEVSLDLGDILRNTIRYGQVANISHAEEVEIGRQINDMLLEQPYELYRNPQVNQDVDQVGQRLVNASDRRDIPYTF